MKSKTRVKQTAEVFTPHWLVEEVLEKLPQETWGEGKTFLDNSCGDGNFLVAVLARKLGAGHEPIDALKTIYGTDIMKDNIQQCRCRLLEVVSLSGVRITKEYYRLVIKNIRWLNQSKFPKGSLDYDFSFRSNQKGEQVEKLRRQYRNYRRSMLRQLEKEVDQIYSIRWGI